FCSLLSRPPHLPLFPYTTLFRSTASSLKCFSRCCSHRQCREFHLYTSRVTCSSLHTLYGIQDTYFFAVRHQFPCNSHSRCQIFSINLSMTIQLHHLPALFTASSFSFSSM